MGTTLVLAQGEGVRVRLTGFRAHTPVQLWLFSEPTLLGELRTDAAGSLAATVALLPEHAHACAHTLQAVSLLPDGRQVAVHLGVWVAAEPAPFHDVSNLDADGLAVGCLADLEVARGYTDGTYQPHRVVTRQAVVAFLHRLAGEPEPSGDGAYLDVPASHPFAVPIAWASEAGIATGYADGTFRPAAPVTRQALAAFLHRWVADASEVPAQAPVFPDVGSAHPFAVEIAWLAEQGITRGYLDGTFRPAEPLRRAPTASLLVRAMVLERVR